MNDTALVRQKRITQRLRLPRTASSQEINEQRRKLRAKELKLPQCATWDEITAKIQELSQ